MASKFTICAIDLGVERELQSCALDADSYDYGFVTFC